VRVLLAHNNFSVHGGAEVFFHEVGRVLTKNGHDVAYFSIAEKGCASPWSDYFPDSSQYQDVSIARKILGFPSMVYSLDAKNKMAKLIKDFQPDLIHAFAIYVKLTPSILDAARLSGVPIVLSCNDYKHICPNYKLYHHGQVCENCKGGRFYNAALNRCSHDSLIFSTASAIEGYVHSWLDIYRKNIHTFLFASEFMAHKTEEFWGKDSFRWRKLRNPFDSNQFVATYRPQGPVIFFGRLIDEKGVDVLVKAASQLPEVNFRVIGDGPDLDRLQNLSDDLGVCNIVFTGPKWGEAMNEELSACRFVVVPSLWHENFPYVINQSFAFGKPVIGSNRGGITELVAHGERGLVYDALDASCLATAIKSLCNDPENLKYMGDNAKRFSDQEFNDETFYRNLEAIYNEVLS